MSLTTEEKTELTRLIAKNVKIDGEPKAGAETAELERINELLGRDDTPREPRRPKLKNHKLSRTGEQLKERGAKYLGAEEHNFGTEEKPVLIVREYFYDKDDKGQRVALMVQKDKEIVIGRTISKNCLDRISA